MLARQLGRVHAQAIRLLPVVDGLASTSRCDSTHTFAIDSVTQIPATSCESEVGFACGGGSPLLPGHSSLLRPRVRNFFADQSRSFASGSTDYNLPGGDPTRGGRDGSNAPLPSRVANSSRRSVDFYNHQDPSDDFQESDERKPNEAEGALDHLLTKWEAMMDGADPEDALAALVEELDGSQGLPEWNEILARGNEEETVERAQRRSREQSLQQEFADRRVRVVDRLGRAYATGKRKCSVARCWIEEGPGKIMVNGRTVYGYFPAIQRRSDILLPFIITDTLGSFDVHANIRGGGLTGQAQALRHGISRALQLFDPSYRPALKAAGLLTRDSRVVERKKPGRPKARKSFQWVKR